MADSPMLRDPPLVNVSCANRKMWRCCPWNIDTQTSASDCCANNIAYDSLYFTINLTQTVGTDEARVAAYAYAPYDKYYVDVYTHERDTNTEWKMHTHEVNWIGQRPGELPQRGVKRRAQIICQNVFNGVHKCGQMPPPNGGRAEGDANTFEEYKEYEVALVVRCVRDLGPHPSHEGTAEMVCVHEGPPYNMTGELCDWTWCSGEMKFIDNEAGRGRAPGPALNESVDWCNLGWFWMGVGPGCSPGKGIECNFAVGGLIGQFGCGPLGVDGNFKPIGPGNKPVMPDDWSNSDFDGTWKNRLSTRGGKGTPDSVMNAVVMGDNPTMPYVDVVQTGATAGFGANYWEGMQYTLAPFGSGVLISGVFYPSGETGNPTGCVACTGTGSPSVPPTGTGCGTCTFYWDTGVNVWTESYYSVACSGGNCKCPAEPGWPAGSVHGETKSTGCIGI